MTVTGVCRAVTVEQAPEYGADACGSWCVGMEVDVIETLGNDVGPFGAVQPDDLGVEDEVCEDVQPEEPLR